MPRQQLQVLPQNAMLPRVGNMSFSGNNRLLERAYEALKLRLPEAWKVQQTKEITADASWTITAPNRQRGRLVVEMKARFGPREAEMVALPEHDALLVLAPYLSDATRARLRERGVNYLDLTGNARITLQSPGLFIETSGADSAPSVPAGTRTLRGDRAGRVVRDLLDHRIPGGVREIAERVGADPGYVSRVLSILDDEAVVRRERRKLVSVDWKRLLGRWVQDAPLSSRGARMMCLEPRGLEALAKRLVDSDKYFVTGSYAAMKQAPIAPPRVLTFYAADAQRAINELGLRVSDRGANVCVIEPTDDFLLSGERGDDGINYVPTAQVAADLLGGTGREPAEGEALVGWMKENEGVWRK